jgi:hypothetical protein
MATNLGSGTKRPSPTRRAASSPKSTEAAWVRVTAVGGFVFFALVICFGTLLSEMPAATADRREVFAYLVEHQDALQLAAALYGLSMVGALLFLCGLFAALAKAEGGRRRLATAAATGGVLAASATLTGALVLGVLANRPVDLGAAGARAVWAMFLMSFGGVLVGHTVMIGSAAAVSLRTGVFARWFGIASVVLALASAVGGLTLGYPAVGIQVVAGVTVVLNSVWILLASTFLWRRPALASG